MESYLGFDSSFECANLCKVVAISPTEYELYLSSDTNSHNRTQWFYFLVTNTHRNVTVKFTLMNQTKSPHFYKVGMTPLVFSEKDNQTIYISWAAKTDNLYLSKPHVQPGKAHGNRHICVGHEPKNCVHDTGVNDVPSCYHTLSFTHTFKYDGDRVYFAFGKPYGFSMLLKYLVTSAERKLRQEKMTAGNNNSNNNSTKAEFEVKNERIYYKREQLCTSLGGIPVFAITLTSPQNGGLDKRRYVIITSRVHSSEIPGSYKIEGILNFLLSEKEPMADSLLREFVFLIVPMMNPDGVVLGNNRCSLFGTDLNRCWGHPVSSKQPTVFALKKKLKSLIKSEKQIYVYCDLHGHSKQMNTFIYACHKVSGAFCPWSKVRLLPRLMAAKCHFLDYHRCRFKVEAEKLSTARVIIWEEFKVVNSFTFESSMYAYTVGDQVVRYYFCTNKIYIHLHIVTCM